MILTRREFFKTVAVTSTALVVMASPLAAFEECPRQIAFRMKDRLVQDFQEIKRIFPAEHPLERSTKYPNWQSSPLGKQWFDDVDVFYEHLYNNITGPQKTFGETVDEVSVILKGVTRDGTKLDIDIMSCTEQSFAICLLRDCLRNHKMPMVQARTWRKFATKYAPYVMTV